MADGSRDTHAATGIMTSAPTNTLTYPPKMAFPRTCPAQAA